MFAEVGYIFGGSAQTTSWNSTNPDGSRNPWNPAEQTFNGDIVSNGDIDVGNGTSVGGDVNDNSGITPIDFSYQSQLAQAQIQTTITDFSGNLGPITDANATTLTTAGSPYHCSAIELAADAILIDGTVEIYVDGPISLSPKGATSANILYKNPSSDGAAERSNLMIFQGDYTTDGTTTASSWDNNGGIIGDAEDITTINNGGEKITSCTAYPEDLVIISEYSGDLTLNGNGIFAAVFIAPKANIKLNGTFNFFGSLSARSFDDRVNGTFSFHYDDSLGNLTFDNVIVSFAKTVWSSHIQRNN
jgi:cytoskeletal protein CcmA (bactofilin family)